MDFRIENEPTIHTRAELEQTNHENENRNPILSACTRPKCDRYLAAFSPTCMFQQKKAASLLPWLWATFDPTQSF